MVSARQRRGIALALAAVLLGGVTACAPTPRSGWKPPAEIIDGLTLLAPAGATSAPGTDAKSPPPEATTAGDPAKLGIAGGRIRNDEIHLQARYALLPGVPKFNARVSEILWGAIKATGKPYTPQAFPAGAGFGARGCIPGSTELSASELLSGAETGPAGGTGTAITCSVIGAFGPYLGVRFRTVTGKSAAAKPGAKPVDAQITADRTVTIWANVRTGEVEDDSERWEPSSSAELWRKTVDLLRDRLGSLSHASVAAPGSAQLALAAKALTAAIPTADGGFTITLPAGVEAPELAALGATTTAAETVVHIPAQTAEKWANPHAKARLAAMKQPFAGLPKSNLGIAPDCALQPCVAVTYDDGPSGNTAKLLDTLRSKHAVATFFMLGNAANGAPDLVHRAVAEGNEVGSHTMTHPDLTTIKTGAAVAQVRDAASVLAQITGTPVTIYRPPYGAVNNRVLNAVGMPAILWSVDTNDWREPGQDALAERSVPTVQPGGIILFHDTHADSVDVAGRVIDGLRDRGFTLVTVSQLFDGAVPAGRVSGR